MNTQNSKEPKFEEKVREKVCAVLIFTQFQAEFK